MPLPRLRTYGFEVEAATGYYLLSVSHQDDGDAVEAQATTLRAAEVSRHADTATTVAQLANTARCLIELEQDIGRSRVLLAEANAMSARRGAKTIEMLWSEALLRRWDGILDAAPPLLEEALQLAREGEDRWRECKCLAWLAVINFERGDPDAALACCEELRPLAAKMGESGELPFVRALEALALLTLHQTGAAHDLVSAVEQLRSFDSKAHLAYILNAAAEIAMAAGEFHEACGIAQEALAAAEATRRVCEIVISRALLARALTAGGDVLAARGSLDPSSRGSRIVTASVPARVPPDCSRPGPWGLRIRRRINAGRDHRYQSKTEGTVSRIIVERSFDRPFTEDDFAAVSQRVGACLDLYGVRWIAVMFPTTVCA